MELRVDTVLTHPLDAVYAAYRDRLPDLVEYLPNVESIQVAEMRREGSRLHLVNDWKAVAEIPAVAERFVRPDMLRWRDIAEWHDDDHSVRWRFEMAFLREAIRVEGLNHFVAEGPDRTRLSIRGILELDGTRIPGLPSFIGKRVAPQVERFVVNLVQPNLVRTAEGVQRFLDDQG